MSTLKVLELNAIFIKRWAVSIIKEFTELIYLVYIILHGIWHLWWHIRLLRIDVDVDTLKWRHF